MNPKYPFVATRAKHVCEYCHAPEVVFNLPFEVEHIIPVSRDGSDEEDNLALSCRSCNLYKSNLVSGFDEETQSEVALFNPRRDVWKEHFVVNKNTGELNGLTAAGRVTTFRLRINRAAQLAARIQWLRLGLFE